MDQKQIENKCEKSNVQTIKINYIENQIFQTKYEQAKQKLISSGIKFEEKLMYHGTSPAAIKSILLNNFDLKYAKCIPNGDQYNNKYIMLSRLLFEL
jgi:hypothetical protein